jgi:hypothetical protein
MFATCDDIGYIRKIFGEMLEKNVVDWNGGNIWYARLGDDEKALKLCIYVQFTIHGSYTLSLFLCSLEEGPLDWYGLGPKI